MKTQTLIDYRIEQIQMDNGESVDCEIVREVTLSKEMKLALAKAPNGILFEARKYYKVPYYQFSSRTISPILETK